MKKRKWLALVGVAGIMTMLTVFAPVPPASANDRVRLLVNGREIQSDVPPRIIGDRVMVSVK